MKLVGVNVWAATSNNTINILNTQTRQSIYMIKNTPDAVTCIELVSVHKSPIASFPKSLQQDEGSDVKIAWCSTIAGYLLKYNVTTFTELSRYNLNDFAIRPNLVAILVVNNTIW